MTDFSWFDRDVPSGFWWDWTKLLGIIVLAMTVMVGCLVAILWLATVSALGAAAALLLFCSAILATVGAAFAHA